MTNPAELTEILERIHGEARYALAANWSADQLRNRLRTILLETGYALDLAREITFHLPEELHFFMMETLHDHRPQEGP